MGRRCTWAPFSPLPTDLPARVSRVHSSFQHSPRSQPLSGPRHRDRETNVPGLPSCGKASAETDPERDRQECAAGPARWTHLHAPLAPSHTHPHTPASTCTHVHAPACTTHTHPRTPSRTCSHLRTPAHKRKRLVEPLEAVGEARVRGGWSLQRPPIATLEVPGAQPPAHHSQVLGYLVPPAAPLGHAPPAPTLGSARPRVATRRYCKPVVSGGTGQGARSHEAEVSTCRSGGTGQGADVSPSRSGRRS